MPRRNAWNPVRKNLPGEDFCFGERCATRERTAQRASTGLPADFHEVLRGRIPAPLMRIVKSELTSPAIAITKIGIVTIFRVRLNPSAAIPHSSASGTIIGGKYISET